MTAAKPSEGEKLPAWSMTLDNGSKVTLVRDKTTGRNVFEFTRDGAKTTIGLSDEALSAVVHLAVTRAGVPVLAG